MLAGWAADPRRFREDANAEEDLALGGYRDRLVVELAQNAADAARAAGVPGRLLLRLADGVLAAANTGAPLDGEGVRALSSLRASAKRDDSGSAGRFGVGFAAVLPVSDTPSVVSRSTGGVSFSRALTQESVHGTAGLSEELARREGHVPVLRLPWDGSDKASEIPDGYETLVSLPLRDEEAERVARATLADVDAALLLALPDLSEVVVQVDGSERRLAAEWTSADQVLLTDDGSSRRWRVQRRQGPLDPALLADRPVEERRRAAWSVLWAVPLDEHGAPPGVAPGVQAVVHAPTPTDEPQGLPGLLVASLPQDPSRRRVAEGPLADEVARQAGLAWADLVAELAAQGAPVETLVPDRVPAGPVDAVVRRAALGALSTRPLLRPAVSDASSEEEGPHLLRPDRSVVVDGVDARLARVLADVVAGLAAPGWPRRPLDALGVRRLELADVVDELAGVQREPVWWHRLYAALEGTPTDALGGLPVPLADGRLVRGPRGLLLPEGDLADGLDRLGLRVVHPDAAHPLLERLGATPATASAVLADPAVHQAVLGMADDPEPEVLARTVLALVDAAASGVPEHPWLAGLLLPDDDGGLARADELLLPGSPAARVLEGLGEVDPAFVEQVGERALVAVGVLERPALLVLDDAGLDPDELDEHDVDGLADWAEDVLDQLPEQELPPLVPWLPAVRDLDLVRPEAWPEVLELLGQPPLRDAVVPPVRIVLTDGSLREVPSCTASWIRRHARLHGLPPTSVRVPGADPVLAALYDEVPVHADPELLRAVGVRTTLAGLLAEPDGPDDLLARLADPAAADRLDDALPTGTLRALHAALVTAEPPLDVARVRTHPLVRVPAGSRTRLVPAGDVVVADGPWWLQLPWQVHPLVAPAGRVDELADLLGVDLASEARPLAPAEPGTPAAVPDVVADLVPGVSTWREHDELVVMRTGTDSGTGSGVEVDWWVEPGDGQQVTVHACTLDGLARGLAWAGGRWADRWLLAALLAEPERREALLAEDGFTPPPLP
ncbi:MAG: sacsin N-terminal ATP-binding-like domain-containing protein [Motilibacteraceae bacterium]